MVGRMDEETEYELFEERAAIMEFDGKMSRQEAERRATYDIRKVKETVNRLQLIDSKQRNG